MKIFLLAVLSYIIGSFPTGVVIGKKFYNIDIREHGSKNMGGTNAGRVLGKKAGIIVTVIDIAKLMIPTYLARRYYGIDIAAIIGACGM
ncbi:MAG TPA: glycerol-3-phosphate acyltransferase, partial [Clostridiaceae bacterium]|nr:glycerol-3-phosphate acyltransferase [Clostridiaceae bacterium]